VSKQLEAPYHLWGVYMLMRPIERPIFDHTLSATSPAGHKPNTYSIDAAVWFFSSGAFWMMNGHMRAPTRTATYCLPLTE